MERCFESADSRISPRGSLASPFLPRTAGSKRQSRQCGAVDAVSANPDSAELWMQVGVERKALGQHERAHEAFSCALLLQPGNVEALKRRGAWDGKGEGRDGARGLSAFNCFRFKDALKDLLPALHMLPNDADLNRAVVRLETSTPAQRSPGGLPGQVDCQARWTARPGGLAGKVIPLHSSHSSATPTPSPPLPLTTASPTRPPYSLPATAMPLPPHPLPPYPTSPSSLLPHSSPSFPTFPCSPPQGFALVRSNQFRAAQPYLARAVELLPGDADVRKEKGRLHRLLGETDEAERDLLLSLQLGQYMRLYDELLSSPVQPDEQTSYRHRTFFQRHLLAYTVSRLDLPFSAFRIDDDLDEEWRVSVGGESGGPIPRIIPTPPCSSPLLPTSPFPLFSHPFCTPTSPFFPPHGRQDKWATGGRPEELPGFVPLEIPEHQLQAATWQRLPRLSGAAVQLVEAADVIGARTHYDTDGMLHNTQQLRMAGLAALDVMQQVRRTLLLIADHMRIAPLLFGPDGGDGHGGDGDGGNGDGGDGHEATLLLPCPSVPRIPAFFLSSLPSSFPPCPLPSLPALFLPSLPSSFSHCPLPSLPALPSLPQSPSQGGEHHRAVRITRRGPLQSERAFDVPRPTLPPSIPPFPPPFLSRPSLPLCHSQGGDRHKAGPVASREGLEAAEDHEGLFNVIGRDFYVRLPCYSRAFPGLVCLPCYSTPHHAQDAFTLKMLFLSRCFHAQDAFMPHLRPFPYLPCQLHAPVLPPMPAACTCSASHASCMHLFCLPCQLHAPVLPPMPAACTCSDS
ncbi:unnamed protein product [Closterium sp. Yama58-4]|nr:unnamed protein product [Closterium sp. Yama58-4]